MDARPDLSLPDLSRVGQIAQPVGDMARAVAFYQRILGLELLYEVPRMAVFRMDGMRLMLALPDGGPERTASILYLTVDDLRQAHAALEARGVSFDRGPTLIADLGEEELWMAFFRDTEGNQLALMSEVAKDAGASGARPGLT